VTGDLTGDLTGTLIRGVDWDRGESAALLAHGLHLCQLLEDDLHFSRRAKDELIARTCTR
jgi:hypothetical protein